MTAPILTQKKLKEIVNYDPSTGIFTWKVRVANRVRVGNVAGSLNSIGYVTLSIMSHRYLAHRMAHLYMTGKYPPTEIDHINGTRKDNRWCNLRQVSRGENRRNQKMRSTNTSGVTGVCWVKREKKWRSRISTDKKLINLGCFKNKYKAIAVRKAAEVAFDYHPNHGRK